MSIATQMQRFKDIGDAIREAIHTRNGEVEVDDLKFDDFADIISTLNNINTDTYEVPADSLLLTYDFGEYNKIRKVDIADFYQAVYDRAESAGVNKCWNATTVVCGMSSDAWSANRKVVHATATCNNTLGMTAKTSSTSISVDATSVYNNGYSVGKADGKYTRFYDSGTITLAKSKTTTISLGFTPSFVICLYSKNNLSSTNKTALSIRATHYATNFGFLCTTGSAYTTGDTSINGNASLGIVIPATATSSWTTKAFSTSVTYYVRYLCWGQS